MLQAMVKVVMSYYGLLVGRSVWPGIGSRRMGSPPGGEGHWRIGAKEAQFVFFSWFHGHDADVDGSGRMSSASRGRFARRARGTRQ